MIVCNHAWLQPPSQSSQFLSSPASRLMIVMINLCQETSATEQWAWCVDAGQCTSPGEITIIVIVKSSSCIYCHHSHLRGPCHRHFHKIIVNHHETEPKYHNHNYPHCIDLCHRCTLATRPPFHQRDLNHRNQPSSARWMDIGHLNYENNPQSC